MSSGIAAFTLFHVALSLVGILAGLVVVFGLIAGKWLKGWTGLFLTTTVATSATGFLFSVSWIQAILRRRDSVASSFSNSHVRVSMGAASRELGGGLMLSAPVISLYLNVFVLIAPAVHEGSRSQGPWRPRDRSRRFLVTQVVVMVVFIVLGFSGGSAFPRRKLPMQPERA